MISRLPNTASETLAASIITALDALPYGCVLLTLLHLGRWLSLSLVDLAIISATPTWLKMYAATEAAFFVYSSILANQTETSLVQRRKKVNKVVDNDKRRRLFAEILHELEGKDKDDIDKWLKGWFYRRTTPSTGHLATVLRSLLRIYQKTATADPTGQLFPARNRPVEVEVGEVKRGNIEELLAGIFFDSSLKTVTSDPLAHHSLTSMVHSLEIRRNHRFPSGHSANILPLVASVNYDHADDARTYSIHTATSSSARSSLKKPNLLKSEHRPLLVYAGLYVLEAIFGWVMYFVGFAWVEHRVSGERMGEEISVGGWWHPGLNSPGAGLACYLFVKLQSHWHRSFLSSETLTTTPLLKASDGIKSSSTQPPIIFIPGLAGPAFLLHLIIPLIALNRPILVTHQPHFSLRLFPSLEPAASIPQLAEGVKAILASRGHRLDMSVGGTKPMGVGLLAGESEEHCRPLIIAHSLGSGLASYLNSNSTHPSTTTPRSDMILLDPINVLLCNPRLTRSIYLDQPRTAMERMIRYFTRSPCVASYLAYEFNPFDAFISLRPQKDTKSQGQGDDASGNHAGGTTKIVLAQDDHLIPVQEIVGHCKRNQVECEVFDNLGHGGWLASIPCCLRIFNIIRETAQGRAVLASSQQEKDCDVPTTNPAATSTKEGSPWIFLARPNYVAHVGGDMIRVRSNRATGPAPVNWGAASISECAGSEIMSKGMSMGRTRSRTIGSGTMREGKSKMGFERMDRIASVCASSKLSHGYGHGHVAVSGSAMGRRARAGTVGQTMGVWA
ncbi:hypothetical protein IAU59_001562 [Kwoniella sp. CBS 9459]